MPQQRVEADKVVEEVISVSVPKVSVVLGAVVLTKLFSHSTVLSAVKLEYLS